MKFYKYIGVLLSLALLSACASEEEKKERKENAFDLAGVYQSNQSTNSDVAMEFEIKNETGRHDIIINLERKNGFSDKERNFLLTAGIDADKVFNHFGNKLVLGRGYSSLQLDGGENISKDFGESSEFYVCDSDYQYNTEYSVRYCLKGKMKKNDKVLNGALVLTWSRRYTVVENNKSVEKFSSNNQELKFQTGASQVFYQQYLGIWIGEVFPILTSFNANQFQKIMIGESAMGNIANTFTVSVFQRQQIEYLGIQYTLSVPESSNDIETLKTMDYPAVQSVYKAANGKRIVLVGQIWSLGDFTGSVILIDGDQQIDLASFRLKKSNGVVEKDILNWSLKLVKE